MYHVFLWEKILNDKIFEDCLSHYQQSDGHTRFWPELAEKHHYKSGEELRDKFKKERRRRGIPARDNKGKIIYPAKQSPKILVFDIETSYIKAAVWGINKQHINRKQILSDWFMLSYAAKWLYDETVFGNVLSPKEAVKQEDKRITQELYELINEADLVITYNGDNFDIPRFNTRAIINGIQPPSTYRSIDVYQTVSRRFSFTSKAMDYVNLKLELDRKRETEGMELWTKCMSGDPEALKELSIYNMQDVSVLQEQYLVVRPWIKNHPNIGLWHDSAEPMCGFCSSTDIVYISNAYQTPAGLYRSFRCSNCKAIGRTNEQLLSKEKRKSLTKTT